MWVCDYKSLQTTVLMAEHHLIGDFDSNTRYIFNAEYIGKKSPRGRPALKKHHDKNTTVDPWNIKHTQLDMLHNFLYKMPVLHAI